MVKALFLLLAISRASGFLDLETGWRQLELQAGVHSISSGYLDFNPLDTRIQMRLTQLRPDDDLRFGIDYEFFEEEKRTSFVSSVNFDWHTKPGHKSGVFLHVGEDFSDCIENNPDMLAIPSFADIDINSDYTVELDRGRVRGSFKDGCEKADDGSDTWRSWKRSMDKIRKMSVKLTDSKFLGPEITLNDFFTMEYRLVHACPIGTFLSDRVGVCLDCDADHFSTGGYPNSCNRCPYGSYVPSGVGFSEMNCTFWYSCPGGYYQDYTGRCVPCKAGHYSAGEDALFCHPCPVDSFSESGARRCTECPWGTGVETGMGRSIDDCQELIVEESGATAICKAVPFIQAMLVSAYCLL